MRARLAVPSLLVLATLAAPIGAAAQAPARWHALGASSAGGPPVLVDVSSRKIRAGTASLDQLTLTTAPMERGGRAYPWIETRLEFDCLAGRYRERTVGALSADRKARIAVGPELEAPFTPVEPGTSAKLAEDLACRGVRDRALTPVRDLAALQKRYAPAPPAVLATAPATMVKAATAAVAATPAAGLVYDRKQHGPEGTGVIVLDLRTRKRSGDTVSLIEHLMLLPGPATGAQPWGWIESQTEYDCAGHRLRGKMTVLRSADRKTQRKIDKPSFDAWAEIPPEAPVRRLQQVACQDQRDDDIVAVSDLSRLRSSLVTQRAARR